MKKLLLLILLFLPILSFSQVITDGLVGYWPFNGNANDESGNGNDGVVNGATLTEDRFGNANSAYSFDGVDDYISVGNPVIPSNGVFTLSFWIYPTALNLTRHSMVSQYHGSGGDRTFFSLINNSGRKLEIFNGESHFGSTDLNTDTWYHIVIVGDGNEFSSYININLEHSDIVNNGIAEEPLIIGNRHNLGGGVTTASDWYDGIIDDITVYDRVLTEDEIYSLYTGEVVPHLCDNIFCDDQNIGIGTPDTHGYKLAVAGSILTEEIKVATQANWPDYVFEEDYPLTDLTELEGYIRKNKHLPEIQDAQTIKEEGYNLSEMDAKLLEKIEMLTLYIIEQNKKLIEQNKKIESQAEENQKQKEGLEKQKEQIEFLKQRLEKLENH